LAGLIAPRPQAFLVQQGGIERGTALSLIDASMAWCAVFLDFAMSLASSNAPERNLFALL
jgi:hypothetical protein